MGYRPENISIATQLRAIDMPCNDHCDRVQQWFETHGDMCQWLAGQRGCYVDPDGSIKDKNGEVVGVWYFVEFNAKYHPMATLTPAGLKIDPDAYDLDDADRKAMAQAARRPIQIGGEELEEIDRIELRNKARERFINSAKTTDEKAIDAFNDIIDPSDKMVDDEIERRMKVGGGFGLSSSLPTETDT